MKVTRMEGSKFYKKDRKPLPGKGIEIKKKDIDRKSFDQYIIEFAEKSSKEK